MGDLVLNHKPLCLLQLTFADHHLNSLSMPVTDVLFSPASCMNYLRLLGEVITVGDNCLNIDCSGISQWNFKIKFSFNYSN